MEKLAVLQRRAIRLIHHHPPLSHTPPLFQESAILPVRYLYQYRILLIAHNNFYNLQHQFTPSHYPTRHSILALPVPYSTSASAHRMLSYSSSSLWNGLPAEIRQIRLLGPYKEALKSYMLGLA
jgi:hypothetical protein